MKKTIAIMLSTAAVALACWMQSAVNYNRTYIAGANANAVHYAQVQSADRRRYYNDIETSLPITVWVKVSKVEHTLLENEYYIQKAMLRYKVFNSDGTPKTGWIIVREYDFSKGEDGATDPSGVSSLMEFDGPVALFGRNTVNPSGVSTGDYILIQMWISDGLRESGDRAETFNDVQIDDVEGPDVQYPNGWTPGFIFRVRWNGQHKIVN